MSYKAASLVPHLTPQPSPQAKPLQHFQPPHQLPYPPSWLPQYGQPSKFSPSTNCTASPPSHYFSLRWSHHLILSHYLLFFPLLFLLLQSVISLGKPQSIVLELSQFLQVLQLYNQFQSCHHNHLISQLLDHWVTGNSWRQSFNHIGSTLVCLLVITEIT